MPSAMVAGALGPVGATMTGHGRLKDEEVAGMFRDQATALVQEGVDLLILETFSRSEEILLAISALAVMLSARLVACIN